MSGLEKSCGLRLNPFSLHTINSKNRTQDSSGEGLVGNRKNLTSYSTQLNNKKEKEIVRKSDTILTVNHD